MADFDSKYSGEQVEALLDQVASGNAGGGGGGITVETDPIFSNSPAASITEDDIRGWNNDHAVVEDLNIDVAQLIQDVKDKQDAISDLATIREGAYKGATAYQKPSGGIPKSDLASDVQASLSNADNAVQKGMVGTLNIINVEGVYDDDYVYALPTAAAKNVDEDYDDIILSRGSVKTINGESIFGSGDISIAGGSGEKGDKGDTGVGVQSVKQTTTSNVDSGYNVVTVTLTDGTTSTFSVKNGSKGSNGTNGTNGKDGADGEDGATFTPSVDSAGNLSWTNNKGLANPPTVNIKGPKGDAGEGGGDSSGGGGVETISLSGGFGEPLIIEEMLAEKRYYLYVDGSTNSETIEIQGFEGHEAEGEVTIKHFYAVIMAPTVFGERFDLSLILPDVDIRWANGGHPSIVGGDERIYELSITQVNDYGFCYYNAVLTPFNYVE